MPPLSTASVKSEEFPSLEEFKSSEPEENITTLESDLKNQSTTNILNTSGNSLIKPFDTENPWDLVPDQPALKKDSNGLKTSSLVMSTTTNNSLKVESTTISTKESQSLPLNVMDDPFDADWVSLALKQTNNQEIL